MFCEESTRELEHPHFCDEVKRKNKILPKPRLYFFDDEKDESEYFRW